MSAPTIDTPDLTITVTSETTAYASDGMEFNAIDRAGLQKDIFDYAGEVAGDEDQSLRVQLRNAATGHGDTVIVSPDGSWHSTTAVPDTPADADDTHGDNDGEYDTDPAYDEPDTQSVAAPEPDAHNDFGNDIPTEAISQDPGDVPADDDGGWDDGLGQDSTGVDDDVPAPPPRQFPIHDRQQRVVATAAENPRPASAEPQRLRSRRRTGSARTRMMMWAIAGGCALAATCVTVGVVVGSHSSAPSPVVAPAAPANQQRPLQSFSGSGPGDMTSGPGVIFSYDYNYYVTRNAVSVASLWAPEARVNPTALQRDIDKVDKSTRHHLDIRETPDPMTYDVTLELTTLKRGESSFHQQFHVVRGDDGQYRIASSKTLH